MKACVCLWDDLDLKDTTIISNCETPQDLKHFAKEYGLNEEKMSACFSIVKKTHEEAIETPYGNIEEAFQFFKETLACHSVKRPPFCIKLFDIKDIKSITEYILNTYFRHFKLYKYAFTPKVTMNLSINYKGLKEEPLPSVETGNNEEEVEPDDGEGLKDEPQEEIVVEEKESHEDNPAMKELKKIIRATLDEQINKLKLNMDQKLKVNEDAILKKVSAGIREPSPKAGKKAGKKK